MLDRNGLRPSRYYVTKDGLVVMASEVGVLDIPAGEHPWSRSACIPGGSSWSTRRRAGSSTTRRSRPSWPPSIPTPPGSPDNVVRMEDLPAHPLPAADHAAVVTRQIDFGYTHEDLRIVLGPMAKNGEEPLGSMGTDTALAVLSERPRPLYDYFKQLFAQVTNPPLDQIREELVTSMESTIGPEGNLLQPAPESCRQIVIRTRCSPTRRWPSSATLAHRGSSR